MATAEMYKQALVQEVYYPKGRFNHDYGKKRFVRAPFLLVKLQSADGATWQDYWMPAPFGGTLGTDWNMQDYLGADNGDGECRHPFGYITKQDIIIDENELGDISPIIMGETEDEDNWKRFHRVGFI